MNMKRNRIKKWRTARWKERGSWGARSKMAPWLWCRSNKQRKRADIKTRQPWKQQQSQEPFNEDQWLTYKNKTANDEHQRTLKDWRATLNARTSIRWFDQLKRQALSVGQPDGEWQRLKLKSGRKKNSAKSMCDTSTGTGRSPAPSRSAVVWNMPECVHVQVLLASEWNAAKARRKTNSAKSAAVRATLWPSRGGAPPCQSQSMPSNAMLCVQMSHADSKKKKHVVFRS
jgi:hypothetical protein